MTATSPKLMKARKAAEVLKSSLGGQQGDLTVADAAAKSGLPLRDAEAGLHALINEYRGHLKATSTGELLFRFPYGFTKPWETRTRLERAAGVVWRGLVGLTRFVVRAWIAIVLIAYALLFLAILLAQVFARSNNDSRDHDGFPGSFASYVLFRMVFDAIFWTFHPFSPFVWTADTAWTAPAYARPRRKKDETPFYEKVNRFFFGPTPPPKDELEQEKLILAEIRAQKGRIGLVDVMRVTGLPRDEADPLMARLMLDYDGTVEVSEEGGIVYRFESIRKTAAEATATTTTRGPSPIWSKREDLAPLTGNELGTNVLIAMLNGFNLLMSLYALDAHLTLDNLSLLLRGIPMQLLPQTGTPMALGVVPLLFSLALFALPLGRALVRPIKRRRLARENARRAVLRTILTRVSSKREPVTEAALQRAWQEAAGEAPTSKEITREVVALGGDVDLEATDGIRYRFPDLELEAKALEAEREAASEEEARVGKVVFSSDA